MQKMPGLAILLAKHAKGSDDPEDMDDEEGKEDSEDDNSHEDAAVDAMMDAIKSGDAESFKDALKSFLELCYPQLGDE